MWGTDGTYEFKARPGIVHESMYSAIIVLRETTVYFLVRTQELRPGRLLWTIQFNATNLKTAWYMTSIFEPLCAEDYWKLM